MAPDVAIPILLYHKIGRPPRGARVPGQYVSPKLFRRHLSYLGSKGHQTVSLLSVAERDCPIPARPLVITFDDGYRCIYEEALPALHEHGFSATVFLVAGALGGSNVWEQARGDVAEALLGLAEVQKMRVAGIEFGSHTLTHARLTALAPEEAAREIADSRARLEDALGAPCLSFAYPYGGWNAQVRSLVAEAGYRVACTTRRAAARLSDDLLGLPRINVRRYNLLPWFRYKLWRARRTRS